MARYTGPTCKLARREGVDLLLKSPLHPIASKCKFDRMPGSQPSARRPKTTVYGMQLREKQKLRRMYGVLERQFSNYYKRAARMPGSTGLNLLQLLEGRLDNVVYRCGFGVTRAECRQLVSHKSVLVNGRCVNIPSYQVSPGDVIEIAERAKQQLRVVAALKFAEQMEGVSWVDVDIEAVRGTFRARPERSDLSPDIKESLVVALYSK